MACYSKRPDSERRVIAIARDRGRFASANSSADGGGRRVHPRGASTAGDEGGSIMKNLLLGVAAGFVLAIVLLVVLFMLLSGPSYRLSPPGVLYPYSRFVADVDEGAVEEVTLQGVKVFGRFKSGRTFETQVPHSLVLPGLTDRLLAKKVTVRVRPAEEDSSVISILAYWFAALICYAFFFGALWLFMTRPVLALIQRLDATKASQSAAGPPPPE